MGAERGQEAGAEITVEFYGIEPAFAADKCLGEGTLSWADFDDMVRFIRRDRAHDRFDGRFIAQKVLAESFAGVMPHDAHG